MSNRRIFLACLLFGGVVLTNVGADAAPRVLFTPAAFAAAQKAGRPILVDITAS